MYQTTTITQPRIHAKYHLTEYSVFAGRELYGKQDYNKLQPIRAFIVTSRTVNTTADNSMHFRTYEE